MEILLTLCLMALLNSLINSNSLSVEYFGFPTSAIMGLKSSFPILVSSVFLPYCTSKQLPYNAELKWWQWQLLLCPWTQGESFQYFITKFDDSYRIFVGICYHFREFLFHSFMADSLRVLIIKKLDFIKCLFCI